MITAMEIRNQRFNKSFRGYRENEVQDFISKLAMDYEELFSENSRLKEKIQSLEYELQKYHKLEDTMNNSLILAQQTAEEYKKSAEQEAKAMLEDSKKRISGLMMVYQETIKRLNMFNSELKSQLNGQVEMLEKNQKKTEDLSAFFYSEDIKELVEKLGKISLEESN